MSYGSLIFVEFGQQTLNIYGHFLCWYGNLTKIEANKILNSKFDRIKNMLLDPGVQWLKNECLSNILLQTKPFIT